MQKGIFVTGTDTGVGKTFVTVRLIQAMKAAGMNVCPLKPVETGCKKRRGELIPCDTRKLMEASGVHEPVDLINPYRLKHPLAPSVAAEIEGVKIDRTKIFASYRRLSEKYGIILVEGAGGIMVPLWRDYLFLDLVRDMGLHLVIVSRPGLGTINHTLLSIHAARQEGISVLGVIFNDTGDTEKDISVKTNPAVIKKLGRVSILGNIPYAVPANTPDLGKIQKGIVRKLFQRL